MNLQNNHPVKYQGFFSRMLLICSSLLLLFSVISSIFIGSLSSKYEKSQFLKAYDLAMVNLSEAFSGQAESFVSLLGKLVSANHSNENLCRLLEVSSYDEVPAAVRSQVVSLLSSLCNDHRHLKGALLYSTEHNMLYYYNNTQRYLDTAENSDAFLHLVPYENTGIDSTQIQKCILDCTKSDNASVSFYGFSATIFRDPNHPLGFFIPLYSSSEFVSILEDYNLPKNSYFCISGQDGSVFFESDNLSPPKGNHKFYTNSLSNTRYGYQVSYKVDYQTFPAGNATRLIILLACFVTFFSFLLYYLTYYFSNKNISQILTGMEHFNVKNLSYRIERPDKKNEFTQIIDGFNQMCQELEKSVERSYIYELQHKKSELYALQTSINPHFLYNTLDMIRSKVLSSDNEAAAKMLLMLAHIYRAQTGTDMFCTIAEETELCENFLLIYQNRFQNFDYEFDIDESVERYALPKNTLQPMIENYFVHGIKTDKQDNTLSLTIFPKSCPDGTYLHILLENNGQPISEERIQELNKLFETGVFALNNKEGFALTNIYSRLKIAFSNRLYFSIHSVEREEGFLIEIRFPAMSKEELLQQFLCNSATYEKINIERNQEYHESGSHY